MTSPAAIDRPEPVSLAALARQLKATADPLRLQILQLLGYNSFAVQELTELLDTTQSGMSHHLKLLAREHWVSNRREGTTVFYRRGLPPADASGDLQRTLLAQLDEQTLEPELAARLDVIEQRRAAQSRQFFQQLAASGAPMDEIVDLDDYGELAAEMIRRACPDGGAEALEVGPGDGRFLGWLAQQFEHVIGLDNAAGMLAQARQQVAGHSGITLLQGDWPDAAPPRQFDAVVMNMVLHHLPAPAEALLRAARRLRRGGVLLVSELCRHEQSWTRTRCGDLWQGFDEDELIAWAQRAGLVLLESQYLAQRNGFQTQVLSFVHPDDHTH